MARINFVVPALSRDRFSGGQWCLFEYAHGLVSHGHDVTIIPIAPSPFPEWFPRPIGTVICAEPRGRAISALNIVMRAGASVITRRAPIKPEVRSALERLLMLRPALFSQPIRVGIAEQYVPGAAPKADITIATSFETARPAALLTGKKFYFGQHFEPYFCLEFPDPVYAEALARQSYGLGLQLIANSSWLQAKLTSELKNISVALCPNAIDHKVFHGEPKAQTSSKHVVVISYGGRNAAWKGFREMAQAMAIARSALPDFEIEWRVYGGSLVPPGEITPYVDLGFLSPQRLCEEYRKADILLSASWYESFPLFPIEAMACGLPVITTQFGTEEYAMHGKTAEIVQPKSPQSIAEGLIKLVKDEDYRLRLAAAGNQISHEFTWDASINRFEEILFG